MKKIVFAALFAVLSNCAFAATKIKLNVAVLRNNNITHNPTHELVDGSANLVYQDSSTYLEVDLVETTAEHILLRCFVSSAEPNGMLIMRGMPYIKISLTNGLGMASLNCDGKDEHFTLIMCACLV